MIGPAAPCLLVDVGDTLLRRDRPGPKRRVLNWLRAEGLIQPALERAAADAVLTAPDPPAAAASLARLCDLSTPQANALLAVMTSAEGEATLTPGALEFLTGARANCWRIVFTTNAVRWAPPLPNKLVSAEDVYVSSARLGRSKHDPRFWRELVARHGVSRRLSMSVGDSLSADVDSARAAGFAAVHAPPGTARLQELGAAIAEAGPPRQGSEAVLAGVPEDWAGRQVISAPNLDFLVERATRTRLVLRNRSGSAPALIARRGGDAPPLVTGVGDQRPVVVAWVARRSDLRMRNAPADLEQALEAAGLSLDALESYDRRHAVSWVREASTLEVRDARIRDVVTSLRARPADV